MTTKKLTKTEIESNLLAENVRVLRCGLYGYVHKGKAIFRSKHLSRVNNFSGWVFDTFFERPSSEIIAGANKMQALETECFIPNELPNTNGEKIKPGNNWSAKVKIPN